ncbi:Lrp/AsnC ligand binding domain-containing protein [Arthrobacter sp. R4]|uniref:Lrp/AsnC ligand binding domain-containing protein n=1 Tax=Arthrobacter sp. R4 TaxID=644417 RepID=UPI003ED971C2
MRPDCARLDFVDADAGKRVEAGLFTTPEVVEVHAATGDADLVAKVLAKDTTDSSDQHRDPAVLTAFSGPVRSSRCWKSCPPGWRLYSGEWLGTSAPRRPSPRLSCWENPGPQRLRAAL